MAKRYTDTELYDREAFLVLPPRLKVAWEILNKRCNFFGVWQISMTKLSFEVGEAVTLEELQKNFKVRVIDGDKLYIEGFVAFQYGDDRGRLSQGSKFHKSVAEKLRLHGLPEPEWKPSDSSPQPPHPSDMGIDTHPDPIDQGVDRAKDKDKVKDKEKNSSSEGGVGETKALKVLAEAVYARYPRKLGKADGIKKLIVRLKGGLDPTLAGQALDRFLAHHKAKGTESDFLPYFSTWVGDLDDWLDPETGQAECFAKDIAQESGKDWEQTAAVVLSAIVNAGTGTGSFAEREEVLGPELHKIAVKAGIQKIRDVQRGSFQLKTIAGMLKNASELLSGGAHADVQSVW